MSLDPSQIEESTQNRYFQVERQGQKEVKETKGKGSEAKGQKEQAVPSAAELAAVNPPPAPVAVYEAKVDPANDPAVDSYLYYAIHVA